MIMSRIGPLAAGTFAVLAVGLHAQEPVLTSFESPGRVSFETPSLNITCRVEWAASPEGPWNASWTHQQSIYVTNLLHEVEVPMFYRVVGEIPNPHLPDISAQQALTLIAGRGHDPEFVILDVRTPQEYASRHVIGAVNLNFYAGSFRADLADLDTNRTYLIYCASGNRSGQAHDTMRELGFREVYNLLGGMGAFQGLPGADSHLEP